MYKQDMINELKNKNNTNSAARRVPLGILSGLESRVLTIYP